MWHGGGNWGDLWSREGLTLRRMRTFIQLIKKGKTVIGMPQSFHYQNKEYEKDDAKTWMEDVAAEANEEESKAKIILTWRQPDSFEKGSALYPKVDNRLVPDVAFMIGPLDETDAWTKKEKKKVDLIFHLRNDQESRHIAKRNVDVIKRILDNDTETQGLSFDLVDWWDRPKFYDNTTGDDPGPTFKYKV